MAEINDQTFTLLLERFDRVDMDNKEIKESLAAHIKDSHDSLQAHITEDQKAHDTLTRHSAYWGLLIFLGTPAVLGILAFVGGWLKH